MEALLPARDIPTFYLKFMIIATVPASRQEILVNGRFVPVYLRQWR